MRIRLASLFFLILSACSQLPMVSPTILKVSVPRNLSAMLVLLADKHNYFADVGLKVVLTIRESPEDCYVDLTEGRVDLAIVDTPTWVYGDNPKVSIVSEVYSTSRGMYLVFPELKTKALSDVKGRSIYFKSHSSEEWFINLMSIAEGLDLNHNAIVSGASLKPLSSKAKMIASVVSNVELASLRGQVPASDFTVFSSRVHFEIYFVAGILNRSLPPNSSFERFLLGMHRAEQALYRNASIGDGLLASLLPEISPNDVKSLREGSVFRMGLSNSLFVLLTEQKKWIRSRYQKRSNTDVLGLRNLINTDFLKRIVPGAVTLTEDFERR